MALSRREIRSKLYLTPMISVFDSIILSIISPMSSIIVISVSANENLCANGT